MPDKRKKKSILSKISKIVSIITIIASALFIISVNSLGFVPKKYIFAIIGVLGFFNLFFGFIGFSKRVNKLNKSFQIIICSALSAALVFATVMIPYYKGKLERALVTIPEVSELVINVYTLKNSEMESVGDLSSKVVGIQTVFDVDNQKEAINDINTYLSNVHGKPIIIVEYNDIYSLSEALLNQEVDAILLNETYAGIIVDNEDFKSFESDVKTIYQVTTQVVNNHDATEGFIGSVSRDPFVVMLGGRDAGGERTDVNILVVVNPKTHKVLMITIPRDAYVAIDGDPTKMDKLTHTSIISSNTWVKSVEYLLHIDIDFYATVGFESIVKIVDALGGIEVDNPYYFEVIVGGSATKEREYYYFREGTLTLNGKETLAYVRERSSIGGDEERNKHQAIVLEALIKKLTSPAIINNVNSFLNSIEGMVVTNFGVDQLYELINLQLNEMPSWGIERYGLKGETEYNYSYLQGYNTGKKWVVSIIKDESIKEANAEINSVLNRG